MSKFLIINECRFPLNVENTSNQDMLPYYRWEHRATLAKSGKRYMVFFDALAGESYIEDVTDGELKKIKDDDEWEEVKNYALATGFLNPLPAIMKPSHTRFV